MRAFLTANPPTAGGFRYKMVSLPNSPEFVRLMVGAMVELTEAKNYEQFGALSPDEMAEYFATVLLSMRDVPMREVGTFVESLRTAPAPNWIACYGQDEAMADWPELMEVYPAILKNYPSAGRFFVPNMQGRTLVGDGVDSSGFNWQFLSQGGSRTHTLTVTEMPTHTHNESIAVPSIINGGLEAPASAATPSAGMTGSAGGGAAHNNMPPYGVMKLYLVGRFLP